ncbi:MAG: DNA polymerase III subunit beta [Ignavibacteriaceae bacterium]|nr:MAG: DNA polymerase III subunit beta [Ignavibacteriaceae bacterium]OQY70273.1 MAG: DNA polymerase III subunit beta [Ignavibacteriales bacterium UTCHB3]
MGFYCKNVVKNVYFWNSEKEEIIMQFTINSIAFDKLITKVLPAVPLRTPMPILENILIEFGDGELTLTANDHEVAISAKDNVTCDGSARFIVKGKLLSEFVKSLGDTLVRFIVENEKIVAKTDSGHYDFNYASPDNFPEFKEIPTEKTLEIDAKVLKTALQLTSFAISKDSARIAMTGVLIDMRENGTHFVSTDAHKLVKYSATAIKHEEPVSIVVPGKTVNILQKLLEDGVVYLRYTAGGMFVESGSTKLVSRLIEHKFPDYVAVIPAENPNKLTISRAPFLSATRRMILMSNKNFQLVKVSLQPDKIELNTEDQESGSRADESIQANYLGEPFTIGFKTENLFEILNNIGGDDLVVELNTPQKAAIFKPLKQEENEDLTMLLMPTRLNTL